MSARSAHCALRNRQGEIWQRLYAVGPATKPLFWEVTSVPDIRRQCEALASLLSARLAPILPSNAEIGIMPTPERATLTERSARQDHPSKSTDPAATAVFLW